MSDHFSSLASQYAQYRPTYPPALFQWLAEQTEEHDTAWDCACGNGQASINLAEQYNKVIATDLSQEQIEAAKPNPKIEYRVATAEKSGLDDHSINLVTVAQAAHWFSFDAFYKEVRRVLKKKGVIALWSYDLLSLDDATITKHVNDFCNTTLKDFWPPERKYVHGHYKNIPFPFEDELNHPAFAMQAHWSLQQLTGYLRSWSAVKYFKKEKKVDPVVAFEKTLAALWGNPDTAKTIRFPLHMRVARV
ncbi:MAG: class I SAM-dependent methyltransferase [Alphaproteobacteria bacterium]